MAVTNLETRYRSYITCLNDRQLSHLSDYVNATVTHNSKTMTVDGYADMISTSITAVPDLFFDIRLLVVNEEQQHVACLIELRGTPQARFVGIEPAVTGGSRAVSFSEHVFYKFRGGKIEEVWSLLDMQGLQEQMGVQKVDT